ncbi:DUF5320 domain-containing protein [Proteiniphilum sp. UBA5375]|uniref:DUF5320 domain-containing protein n=1 Tax=Proteiniphilum sp. UBA5375 TaxID=1947278 RepID=UPI00258106DF|nr:DUF5320 domain-containing protein [Proteiniphilum sp. UBA5375]
MPGFNRKGPEGEGAMSGRGRGRCNPSNRESNIFDAPAGAGRRATFRQEAGRGMDQGAGRGMGQGQGQCERMRRRDGFGKRRMG